jgi:hypothetical protein
MNRIEVLFTPRLPLEQVVGPGSVKAVQATRSAGGSHEPSAISPPTELLWTEEPETG